MLQRFENLLLDRYHPAQSTTTHKKIFMRSYYPIKDYAQYLLSKIPGGSHSYLIIALVYIDRLLCRSPCILDQTTVCYIVATAFLLTGKMWDDMMMDNGSFGTIINVPVRVLNRMERTFIKIIDYNLGVSRRVFLRYVTDVFDTRLCRNTALFSVGGRHHRSHISCEFPPL
jgi:hypothetical protein